VFFHLLYKFSDFKTHSAATDDGTVFAVLISYFVLDVSQPLSNLYILHPAFLILILFSRNYIFFFHMMIHPFVQIKDLALFDLKTLAMPPPEFSCAGRGPFRLRD
jgi:hypothetical protein